MSKLLRVLIVEDSEDDVALLLHELHHIGSSNIICNADMRVGEIRQFCKLQAEGQSLMQAAMSQLNLSARAYHRILKLARTSAYSAGSKEIQSAYVALYQVS